MEFGKKLKLSLGGRKRAEVAKAIGVPAATFNDYLNKNVMPRADIGILLAKELNVDANWLFNPERKEEVPVWAGADLVQILERADDLLLMKEVAKRYRREAVKLYMKMHEIEFAEDEEWIEFARRILSVPFNKKLPADLEPWAERAGDVGTLMFPLNKLMPDRIAALFHAEMPGSEMAPIALEYRDLEITADRIQDMHRRGIDAIRQYLDFAIAWNCLNERREEFEFYRRELRRRMDTEESITIRSLMNAWDDEQQKRGKARPKLKAEE